MSKSLSLRPRLSEKAYALSQVYNTYVFEVPKTSNKVTIAKAVAEQFKVTVEDVRIAIIKGKPKKSYQKGNRPLQGKRADSKRAYVRLKAGESINIYGEEEKKTKKSAETTTAKPTQKATEKGVKQSRIRQVLGRAPRQTQNKGGDK